MKTSARCAALLIVALLPGCYSTRFVKEPNAAAYPPVQIENVKIFWTEASAPAHEVLGILTFEGDAIMLRKDDVLYAFVRRKAGELGANGVILKSGNDPGGAARIVSQIIPGVVRREKTVIAIRYKEGP